MSFLHPWLLLGTLGAAVPVLLHFFGRRQARRLPFSSLMLIQKAQRERSALSRVRQLLLMILRALAILLLSLAAAQPTAPLRGPLSDTVVVLDTTPSMRAMDRLGLYQAAGGDTRAALRAAVQLVAGSRRVGTALLAEMADPSHTARDADDPGRFQAVDNASLLARDASYDPESEDRSLVFVTDLQASSWLSAAALPPGRHVVVVDCGRETPNRSLIGIAPREPTVIAGRPTELLITGRATTGPTGPAPVRLSVDGREIATVQLALGPEPTQAVFEWRPDSPGVKRLEAALPADAMAADDICYATVSVRERLRVQILGAGPAERLMALALAPAAGAPVAVAAADRLPARLEADTIIVSQAPTAAELGRLKQASAAGVGLILIAPRVPLAALRELSGDSELDLKAPRPGPLHLGEFDAFRAPLRAFANPQAGDLARPVFRQVPELSLRPTHWHVMARFEDGSPALANSGSGPGGVLLVALPLDPLLTDLPEQPVFVPLLHRLAGFVARQAEAELGGALVGEPIRLPWPGAQVMQVVAPNGEVRQFGPDSDLIMPQAPGFHRLRWSLQGRQRETPLAVNVDPAEGDLRRTTAQRVQACLPGSVTVVRPEPDGTVKLPPLRGARLPLAGPLLAFVLVLLLLELALSQRLRLPFARRGEA